jgi:hypothetical protein
MRRRVMQAVLCALLGLTVALAWWVGQARGRSLAVKIGEARDFASPYPYVSLSVRFPEGWVASTRRMPSHWSVVAEEQKSDDNSSRRMISVAEYPLPADAQAQTPEEFATSDLGPREHLVRPGKIDFLGNPGVLIDVPPQIERDDDGSVRRGVGELYACTILPASHMAVTVRLLGPLAFAPADFDIVRSVAQSLKPIPSKGRPGNLPPDDQAEVVQVRIKRTDGEYKSAMEPGGVWVCEITSPKERGKVRLELHGDQWPRKIAFRFLHFTALDEFTVKNDAVRLYTSLNGNPELSRIAADGTPSEIPYDVAYATPVANKKGYIEVTLPQAIVADSQWVEVHWANETK